MLRTAGQPLSHFGAIIKLICFGHDVRQMKMVLRLAFGKQLACWHSHALLHGKLP
jgi:hypothetical protein